MGQRGSRKSAGASGGVSYSTTKSIALPDQSLVHVNLRFKDVGGRIDHVAVTSSKGEQYHMPEASLARLRALQKANDVPLIVQEVLAAF